MQADSVVVVRVPWSPKHDSRRCSFGKVGWGLGVVAWRLALPGFSRRAIGPPRGELSALEALSMRWPAYRTGSVFAALTFMALGYLFAQLMSINPIAAQAQADKGVVPAGGAPAAKIAGNDKRVIAYVYGNVPITREEFGEHLIGLYGKEKVKLFVNQRIIEMAAAKRNVTVTLPEIDAVIDEDCKKLGMASKAEFEKNVLKPRYGSSLNDWRNNSIRPRLLLLKMCRDQLKMDEQELKQVFQNLYGEKIQCKVILYPDKNAGLKAFRTISKDDLEFDQAARSQPHTDLRARAGEIDPIGRFSGTGTAKIEDIAFKMADGQLSEVIDLNGAGAMVIKRIRSIPARTDVTFESVRASIVKELTDRKLEQAIPEMFAKLNTEANPLFLIAPGEETSRDLANQTERLLETNTKSQGGKN
jgi:hypothetical protein